jgi:hypothetical protein
MSQSGNITKAIQLMEEAISLSKELPNARIFSSEKYEYVSQEKFISEGSQRLQHAKRVHAAVDSVNAKEEGRPSN